MATGWPCHFLSSTQLAAQALSLVYTFLRSLVLIVVFLPYALLSITFRQCLNIVKQPSQPSQATRGVEFYVGTVMHARRRPKENKFSYPVRMALIDLDKPPYWWVPGRTGDTLNAQKARSMAGTNGPVHLLTHPPAANYVQNPISVYYCYSRVRVVDGDTTDERVILSRCLAEVTNTPWGERVWFAFNPGLGKGTVVPKALHVSPLMDMQSSWYIKASEPDGKMIFVSVSVSHPEMGDFFTAALSAHRDVDNADLPNEMASFKCLLQYGFQPQRVAFWIYWQAIVLLWKGISFYSPPDPSAYRRNAEAVAKHPKLSDGKYFKWRPAGGWPWVSLVSKDYVE